MNQFVKVAHDSAQTRKGKELEKELEDRKVADTREVMSTPAGRRWVSDLLDYCGLFRSGYTAPDKMLYNEGVRAVASKVFADVKAACPELFFKMLAEAEFETREEAAKNSVPPPDTHSPDETEDAQ